MKHFEQKPVQKSSNLYYLFLFLYNFGFLFKLKNLTNPCNKRKETRKLDIVSPIYGFHPHGGTTQI